MPNDPSDVGKRRFAEKLRSITEECPDCGFRDTILESPWNTESHRHSRSGHLLYELTCPDCNETITVEINVS